MEFIITCGTSQFEGIYKNNQLQQTLHINQTDFGALHSYFDCDDPNMRDQFISDAEPKSQALADAIIRWYRDNAPNQFSFVGKKKTNPMGAELSTLLAFFTRKNINPKSTSEFHILRSNTYKGWFCALVLKKIIEGLEWGVCGEAFLVDGLRECPDRNDIPLQSLALRLIEIIKLHDHHRIAPILIGSGGFKSVIPVLTIFSTLYALPLYYLFEDSNLLQELSPTINHENQGELQTVWKKLSKSNYVRNTNWFNTLLDLRKEINLPWV